MATPLDALACALTTVYAAMHIPPTKETAMRSPIIEHHKSDEQGRPTGGVTQGRGFHIDWQDGPLAVAGVRREPNGAFVEDILAAAIGRIEFYQSSEFACEENADALVALTEAAKRLDDRTKARQARGVEGTHTA